MSEANQEVRSELLTLARRNMPAFISAISDLEASVLESASDDLSEVELYQAAEAIYRELIRRSPDTSAYWHWLGRNLYFEQTNASEAENALSEGCERFPDDDDLLAMRATNIAWGMGDHRRALPLLSQAALSASEDPWIASLHGWCLLCTGEIEEGCNEVRRSLSFDDAEPDLTLANQVYLYLLGESDERATMLTSLLALLEEKRTVNDWDFSPLVQQARERSHPESAMLPTLIAVVLGDAAYDDIRSWGEQASSSQMVATPWSLAPVPY